MSDSAPTLSGWETYQERSLSYLEPCPSHSSYQYSERERELELGPGQEQYDEHFLPDRDHRYLPSRQAERSRVRGVWDESGGHHHHRHQHHEYQHHQYHHASSPDLLHPALPPPSRPPLLSPYTNYHQHHEYHGSFPELNQHQTIQSHRY